MLGDSTPDVPAPLPSRFCASVTLILGSATSDMAWEVPCVLWDVSEGYVAEVEIFARVRLLVALLDPQMPGRRVLRGYVE